MRVKRLIAIHPHLEVLVCADVFEGSVPAARGALAELDGEVFALERRDFGDFAHAGCAKVVFVF